MIVMQKASLSRRKFLKCISCGMCALGLNSLLPSSRSCALGEPAESEHLKEVMFYKKLPDLKVECGICPKKCRIADFERGYCGNKENRSGTYYTLIHSRPCAVHTDPIEKKPLFHCLPSSSAFSIATTGCNFECRFCQNWDIAQYRPEQVESSFMPPEMIARLATEQNCRTIAYTYSEPTVFYEYMYDCAVEGQKTGVGSVMISNGFINEEPLRSLCSHLTAVKIDLKSFSGKFYKDYCSGELEPVLKTLQVLKNTGVWYEIVVLIIPTLNDDAAETRQMVSWVMKNLGPDVPIHFTRFHPMYKIKNLPPTPVSTLETCYKTAREAGLRFVYIGNVPDHQAENTYCPRCQKLLIQRMSYIILHNSLKDGKCSCGQPIPGVWKLPLKSKPA
jgi:pyruvate formate lyase activating enzyme